MQRLILATDDSGAGHLKRVNRAEGGKVLCLMHRLVRDAAPLTDNITDFFKVRKTICETQPAQCGYWDYCMDEGAATKFEEIQSLWDKYDRVEFWVDPFPNAQLLFIQFLDWVQSRSGRDIGKLFLIQSDSPLGDRNADDVRSRNPLPQQIKKGHFRIAQLAWNAFRHSTPERWADLLDEDDLIDLPYLQRSVLRMLEELPNRDTGLSKTEARILELIADGKANPKMVLQSYKVGDDLPVLDYWEAGKVIDLFSRSPNPAVIGLDDGPFNDAMHSDRDRLARYNGSHLALSKTGHDLLSRKVDLKESEKINRWWGGTNLTNDNCWRWDAVERVLIQPN